MPLLSLNQLLLLLLLLQLLWLLHKIESSSSNILFLFRLHFLTFKKIACSHNTHTLTIITCCSVQVCMETHGTDCYLQHKSHNDNKTSHQSQLPEVKHGLQNKTYVNTVKLKFRVYFLPFYQPLWHIVSDLNVFGIVLKS